VDRETERIPSFLDRLRDAKVELAFIADPDSVFYFSGFWGYLGMDWDRATMLALARDHEPILITPAMEAEMGRNMSGINDVREWIDGEAGEWPAHVQAITTKIRPRRIGVDTYKTHPRILEVIRQVAPEAEIVDIATIVGAMRMIKTPHEIATMRQAGQVAVAMVEAGRGALAEGVPEYEVALAIIAGGTRKAAEFLNQDQVRSLFSPTIYNLGIMQSGRDMCMVHRRSTVKKVESGDPVYFCFCGIANFKQFKLGFDRTFFVKSADKEMARAQETAVRAQKAAVDMVRAGAVAEDVHFAAEEVYRSAGHGLAYRTGRGIGYSFLEEPQLKRGNKAKLQAGMTIVIDGGVTIAGRGGGRVGDSLVVNETGFEFLTPYPRELAVLR